MKGLRAVAVGRRSQRGTPGRRGARRRVADVPSLRHRDAGDVRWDAPRRRDVSPRSLGMSAVGLAVFTLPRSVLSAENRGESLSERCPAFRITMATRVLIADDSEFMRNLLQGRYSKGVRIVGEAENGVEAVNMYEEHGPDLVMMDIVMPIRDGIEATTEILETNPEATVIMCTSVGQEGR